MKVIQNIAVLLTCHNRKEKTVSCLKALFEASLPRGFALDVFLVDDGSTDGTSAAVKKIFPGVNIIQGDGNLFWNRGMHLAWKTAAKVQEYDFYLWLNDDTLLYPNSLQELIECSESTNRQKIICGSTCASNDVVQVTYGGRLLKQGLIIPNGMLQQCDYFNGNIVLIPSYVYNRNGVNDPIFHHALGDFDYGLLAKKIGIHSFVAPSILGKCDLNIGLAAWQKKGIPLVKRLKILYSPLGNNPVEFFKYDNRHNGFFIACFHFFTIHLRLF